MSNLLGRVSHTAAGILYKTKCSATLNESFNARATNVGRRITRGKRQVEQESWSEAVSMRKSLVVVSKNLDSSTGSRYTRLYTQKKLGQDILPGHIARYVRSIPIEGNQNNPFNQTPSLGPAQQQQTGKLSKTLQCQALSEKTWICLHNTPHVLSLREDGSSSHHSIDSKKTQSTMKCDLCS